MTTRGIDFTLLSLCDALDVAVLIEEEANERYEEFADQMRTHHSADAERFFAWMAKVEHEHKLKLDERRGKLFPTEPRRVKREQIFDIEAPDYSEAKAFMTRRQALEVALRCEEKAHAFFEQALKHVSDEEVRLLFDELLGEEAHHIELVKRELGKLPPDDPFKQEDFEDEPVGH